MKSHHYILLASLFLAQGCSSSVTLNSTPDQATVSVKTPTEEIMLGKTPLTLDLNEIASKSNSWPLALKVVHRTTEPLHILIPKMHQVTLTYDLQLTPLASNNEQLNDIINQLNRSQRILSNGDADEAIRIAKKIIDTHPSIAGAYEILATAYFLQRHYQKSYNAWLSVVYIDPNNAEAAKMISFIESLAKKN